MKTKFYYHRHSNHLVENDEKFKNDYNEIISVINSVSDEELVKGFNQRKMIRPNTKSLSEPVNYLLKEKLLQLGWKSESGIFKEPPYNQGNRSRWRLDFAKNKISIEVAFNHGEAIAHNILKPVLSSEESSLDKEYVTQIGIIITATKELKKSGNFDSATGTFDDFIEYFHPYSFFIRCPMIIIGIEGLETFYIDKKTKMPVKLTNQ